MSQVTQDAPAQPAGMGTLPAFVRWLLVASAVLLTAASVNHLFNLGFFINIRLLEIHPTDRRGGGITFWRCWL